MVTATPLAASERQVQVATPDASQVDDSFGPPTSHIATLGVIACDILLLLVSRVGGIFHSQDNRRSSELLEPNSPTVESRHFPP